MADKWLKHVGLVITRSKSGGARQDHAFNCVLSLVNNFLFTSLPSILIQYHSKVSYHHLAVLDISARPLAQASVKSVGQVQILDHSPVWQVQFSSPRNYLKIKIKK